VAFGKFYKVVHKNCSRCSAKVSSGSILIDIFGDLNRERWEGAPFDLLIFEFLLLMEKKDAREST